MDKPSEQQITVEENHYRFLWGLITFMCLLTGAVLFDPLQNSGSEFEQYGLIVVISMLFTSGIWGIYRTIQPIYTAELKIKGDQLTIDIYFGENQVKNYAIVLENIHSLTFHHRTPPGPDEALYDFSTDYIAVYRTADSERYRPLIDISPELMTMKIQDIADIISFIRKFNADVHIPADDRKILGI